MSRLAQKYTKEIAPLLMKEYKYASSMQMPRLLKICVSMGLGRAVGNARLFEAAEAELAKITGQKAATRKAKKSIAAFKLREGMPIGLLVTLRRDRMWQFMDKFVSVVLPQVRDFRGVSRKSFDGLGNYTLGIREQMVFPEISFDDVDETRGMNIILHTSAHSNEEGQRLLELLGMPFRKA